MSEKRTRHYITEHTDAQGNILGIVAVHDPGEGLKRLQIIGGRLVWVEAYGGGDTQASAPLGRITPSAEVRAYALGQPSPTKARADTAAVTPPAPAPPPESDAAVWDRAFARSLGRGESADTWDKAFSRSMGRGEAADTWDKAFARSMGRGESADTWDKAFSRSMGLK